MSDPCPEDVHLPGMTDAQSLVLSVQFTPDHRRFRVVMTKHDFTGRADVLRAWPWADASPQVLAYRLEKFRSRVLECLTPF